MSNQTTFDNSLSQFVSALSTTLSINTIESGWVLRDASGRLSFISVTSFQPSVRETTEAAVESGAHAYCRRPKCILHVEDPGVESLLVASHVLKVQVSIDNFEAIAPAAVTNDVRIVQVRIIDRRIVGADWLTQPTAGWEPPDPARIVFSSLKGGVGRSTALAVVATALARSGKKILVVDLDLEAPGIGTMLVQESRKPKFGALDWYVERTIGAIQGSADDFLTDMIAPSPFGGGNGLIDVVPAVGRTSDEQPANVLAKLARAYLDVPQETEQSLTFLDQTQVLVDQLSKLKTYDAVLVDSRAGLNESTAAAVLGLGADVLLFGVDTPQTFSSYRYLLAHLSQFVREENDDWVYRLRMVHAKASPDSRAQSAFRDRAFEVFREFLYRDLPLTETNDIPGEPPESDGLITTQQFGLDDPTGPHYAWRVLVDSNYFEFDPLSKPTQLEEDFYVRSYSSLIEEVTRLLSISGERT